MGYRRFFRRSKSGCRVFWEIHRMRDKLSLYRRWGFSNGDGIRVKIDRFDCESELENVETHLIRKRLVNGYREEFDPIE